MIAAAIDLGTNTFHLIIAKFSPSGMEILHKRNEPVKLGEGRLNENIIIPDAFERGLRALESFRQDIDAYQTNIVKATATSAVRNAKNGTDFVKAAKARSGIDIDVITGDQEAEYIFQGVKGSGTLRGNSLVMDIGGGSTEFIICEEGAMLWKQSFDIGAARLMQAYFHSDPIDKEEIKAITAHVDKVLLPLLVACAQYQPVHLIGSAGAFESFATMISEPHSNPKDIASGPIDRNKYRDLSAKLITSSHLQRKQMPGLIPLRVDMIVIASILTDYILDRLRIDSLSLSTYDLKFGVLYSLSKQTEPGIASL
jgi:exopolyphosphatase/guanosine-5'-triphosphate,3'-diphosphate pyrophosphatase